MVKSNQNINLSIIVACYNVYPYIINCLKSLTNLKYPKQHLEILLIDDGSIDKTYNITSYFAHHIPFMHVYHENNRGLSGARNTGMKLAHGKYIAFVDGDDVVPRTAYSNLMYKAKTTHANIVSGFVRRFDNLHDAPSALHKLAIKRNANHTTIEKSPNLLYDTTAWNKVYLKDFLLKNHLSFHNHILYEDLPFTLKAYLLSNNNATITNTVYRWRWRDKSITNSRDSTKNYIARLHSLNICRKELLKAGYNEYTPLYLDFIYKILYWDLNLYLENVGDNDEDYIYKVQELTYKFLRNWHINGHSILNCSLFSSLPIKTQVLYYAVKTCNLPLLQKFTYVSKNDFSCFESHQLSKRYDYVVPLSKNILKNINIHDNVLPIQQTLISVKAHAKDDIHCKIVGKGVFRAVSMRLLKHPFVNSNYHETLNAKLVNLSTNTSMPINIKRTKTPVYKRIIRPQTAWTNTHYSFNFNQYTAINKIGYGIWRIRIIDKIKNTNEKKPYVISSWLGQPNHSQKCRLKNYHLKTSFTPNWELEFYPRNYNTTQPINIINSFIKDNYLLFECFPVSDSILPVIHISHNRYLKGSILRTKSRNFLCFNLKHWKFGIKNKFYNIKLLDRDTYYPIQYNSLIKSTYLTFHKNSYVFARVYSTAHHNIRFAIEYEPLMLVKSSHSSSPYCSLLTFSCPYHLSSHDKQLNKKYGKIVLLSSNREHRYAYDFNNVIWNKNTIHFNLPIYDFKHNQLHILKGKYNIYLYMYVNNIMHQFGVCVNTLNPHLLDYHYKIIAHDNHSYIKYKLSKGIHNQLEFKIKQSYTGWDAKASSRATEYSLIYPLMRWLPIDKNLVLFDAYWGTQFSSNERAIYHYIQKHYPHMHTAWILKNNQIYVDGTGERIKANSLKYWYYLARAKYIFQNTNMRNRYYKVLGQIETETLHGTFLKRMGFDEPQFKYCSQKKQDDFTRRISRWDYMITPSNYMTKVASHAFDYHKKILPFGFPRTDALIHHNNHKDIVKLKKKLNIPLDKKIILYAPTYRNKNNDFHLNLKKLHKQVGNNVFILIRLHYFVAHTHSFYQYPKFVKDVSDYPDINDLFLVSDALITDYSSVMFDYAYLERPMIFYAYDEDYYLNPKIRGTYLNYDNVMPGPIVHTQNSLAYQINHLNNIQKYYHKQIVAFSHKFAQYGRKGDATKRVVNYIFKHNAKPNRKQLKTYQDVMPNIFGKKLLHIFGIYDFQTTLLHALSDSLPKKNIIMFDSFFGTSYSDNPKYLYLYIKKRYPKYKCYWNIKPEEIPYFKKHHIPYVIRFSYRGILKQAQAKYWITNARRPLQWKMPRNTKLLMTWHGTPLKTLGSDVKHVVIPNSNTAIYHRHVYLDNRRWSNLITPNLYSAHIMHRAFRMKYNQLIVTGYPRNDVLVNHRNDYKLKNQLKQRLHIPLHKKVILYAPTWRDNRCLKEDEFTAHLHLNLDKMKKHYGNNVIILIRTHYMINNHIHLNKFGNFVKDVSDYPDINDLYLVSDVLITDYSSAMFDYTILHRPIIFFDYDFQSYANNIRGFYFDIRKFAPGPIVTTTNQVIYQLDKIINSHWKPNAEYNKFVHVFDQFEDGKNCKRVLQQFFGNNVYVKSIKKHPTQIHLYDGSLVWPKTLNLAKAHCFKNGANYNSVNPHYKFTIFGCIQLYTKYWNVPLGHKFYLIYINHDPVWCNSLDTKRIDAY